MNTRMFTRTGAIALSLLGAAAGTVSAQMQIDAEVVPFVGGSFFVADARAPFVISRAEGSQVLVQEGELRDAPAVGLSAGLRFADRVGLEGVFAWTPTRLVGASIPYQRRVADVRAVRYGVWALYHWPERARVRPFAGVAVSSQTLRYPQYVGQEGETETRGGLTAGAQFPIGDRLALRVQALQDVVGTSDRARRDQLMIALGLSWRQPMR